MNDQSSGANFTSNARGKAALAQDRSLGALLGLAVGDALGATLEFCERDQQPLHTEITGGGPFHLPPGAWTDDTSMALCLADSLLNRRRVDRFDFARRLVAWVETGANSSVGECFDIGATTASALREFKNEGVILGGTGPRSAGNGSLVRVAPIAIAFGTDRWKTRDMAAWQSSVTHSHPDCLGACGYLALALADAIEGHGREKVLTQPGPWTSPTIQALAAGEWRSSARAQVRSTGYVVDTLEAALWAVQQTDTFEAAVVLAVNLGGDADSVGAVTGQLAGALYGAAAIPDRWCRRLAQLKHLQAQATKLFGLRTG